jgi:hypothetical protein
MITDKKPFLDHVQTQLSFWILLLAMIVSIQIELIPALTSLNGSGAQVAHSGLPNALSLPHEIHWDESFDYADGELPSGIRVYGKGGTLHQVAVKDGQLVGQIDTNMFYNMAALQWTPIEVAFHKNDLFSLTYQGYERQGLRSGNWSHRIRLIPLDESYHCLNMHDPGIELVTQERLSQVWVRGYSGGQVKIIASSMYQVSSGLHSYRLEINHQSGDPRPGTLWFYRDDILVAFNQDILPYLSEVNQLRFLLTGDDPTGASHAWDEMHIRVLPYAEDPDEL